MTSCLQIRERRVGPGQPVYVIAELSANHQGSLDRALELIAAAKASGADAIKVQTYTADTLTIPCDAPPFRIGGGTLWDGRTLHELYSQAYMPWEWQPRLKTAAEAAGMDFFSSPFDDTAVAFLERMGVPAYKIASFELVDLPLLERVARTGRPVILSTGMASLAEIEESVGVLRKAGATQLALLKCTSAYPAPPSEMNLRTLADMARRFEVPVGLSDHTMGIAATIAAVALGACIIEKHFTISRAEPGPDSAFSLEPSEFRAMVDAVRATEQSLGEVQYEATANEGKSRIFRRSLFVTADIRAGEPFTAANVRSIRPAHGLHPRHLRDILGRRAAQDLPCGTPLQWSHVATET